MEIVVLVLDTAVLKRVFWNGGHFSSTGMDDDLNTEGGVALLVELPYAEGKVHHSAAVASEGSPSGQGYREESQGSRSPSRDCGLQDLRIRPSVGSTDGPCAVHLGVDSKQICKDRAGYSPSDSDSAAARSFYSCHRVLHSHRG